MNAETAVLQENGLQVTTGRFSVDGQTFALRNITSVKIEPVGSMTAPLFFAILAVAAFGASLGNTPQANGAIVFALIFALIAWRRWRRNSALAIVIQTSGKEQVASTTHDKAHAERVLQALNDAIAQR